MTATCGSCDYRADGFIHRCYEPAPYRADFRWLGGDGEDYTVPVCPRHAADARTHDSLKRIYATPTGAVRRSPTSEGDNRE